MIEALRRVIIRQLIQLLEHGKMWEALGEDYYLMFDFMINHISRESKFFPRFQKNHEQSPYKEMFIRIHEFFPENRPTQEDIDLIYKRKDKAPFQTVEFADGTTEEVWNTFGKNKLI